MRQVPRYLLIGNGRVARHIQHYFTQLGLSFTTWQRNQSFAELQQHINDVTHIVLLISDQQIEEFITLHLTNTNALLVHFSGSLVSDKAYGAHPLMTFTQALYSLDHYQRIPFVIDHDAPAFDTLLPGLLNPHVRLDKSLKTKYHALCVLSGNFSCMLWQKLFTSLEQEFNLPADIAQLYMQQQTQNLMTHPKTALTGPLVRGDTLTIEKNMAALAGDPFKEVYESFVKCYESLK
jgi:predicted short-subunit dehydrogenase-like oxidoreductase (DUF2520 family)